MADNGELPPNVRALRALMPSRAETAVSHMEIYEHNVVSKILSRYRLQAAFREIGQQLFEETGSNRFSLAQFNAVFPLFPIWMGVVRIPKLADEFTLRKVFKNFYKCKFVKAFDELTNELGPVEKPVAVIFPAGHVDEIGCATHNYDLRGMKGTRLLTIWNDDDWLFFEPLRTLLDAIDAKKKVKDWAVGL